jgi:hypothetical protein
MFMIVIPVEPATSVELAGLIIGSLPGGGADLAVVPANPGLESGESRDSWPPD